MINGREEFLKRIGELAAMDYAAVLRTGEKI
jgi:hypothetical protein